MRNLCVFCAQIRCVETLNSTCEVCKIDVSSWKSSRVKFEISLFRPAKLTSGKNLYNFLSKITYHDL